MALRVMEAQQATQARLDARRDQMAGVSAEYERKKVEVSGSGPPRRSDSSPTALVCHIDFELMLCHRRHFLTQDAKAGCAGGRSVPSSRCRWTSRTR